MGTKLDEAHQELARIAAALRAHPLDEGAKQPGESRKDRKRQENLERFYHRKAPLDQPIHQPYRAPARPQVPARQNPRDSVKNESAAWPDCNAKPGSSERLAKLKGVLQRAAAVGSKQRLTSDVALPRTLAALRLDEERSSTTFKPCKERAMVSTPHLRHRLPKNMFVKPSDDNPTMPIRPCRASLGGVARSLQPDMADASEAEVKQVLRRANSMTGGTRGALNMRLWGTGVGGQRMETFRGPPGTPKRTDTLAKKLGISKKEASKLHGVSTGRADNQKHTAPYSPPGGSKGPAGNREVPRHPLAHAKPPSKETNKKTKRTEKREAGKIARGQARIGR